MLSFVPTIGTTKRPLDLPGMLVVAEHHQHLRRRPSKTHGDCMCVSRLGITRLGSHSGAQTRLWRRQRLSIVKCERVEELLLSGEIKPVESPSFYSCHSGGFVQLLPSACLDKLEAPLPHQRQRPTESMNVMKKHFLRAAWSLCAMSLAVSVQAQVSIADEELIVGCEGVVTDSGGSGDGYGPDEDHSITICPPDGEETAWIEWQVFDLDPTSTISVYDGETTFSAFVGTRHQRSIGRQHLRGRDSNESTGCLTISLVQVPTSGMTLPCSASTADNRARCLFQC